VISVSGDANVVATDEQPDFPPVLPDQTTTAPSCNLLTKPFLVLLCIARDPEVRLRDIATELGITERRAYDIVRELTEAGYVIKQRIGRRNLYEIQDDLAIPESLELKLAIGEVLDLLVRVRTHHRTGLIAPR
jgi:DNA-binding transcriptional ArsR family regulator